MGTNPKTGEVVYRPPDPQQPLAALVFKIVSDPYVGRLAYFRVYDQVLVLAGKNRGARGRVMRVYAGTGKALVEHVNMMKRHTRPNPQKGIAGGILEREAPIQISNLMVICPECGAPSRLGRKAGDDGPGQRVCKKCGATFS